MIGDSNLILPITEQNTETSDALEIEIPPSRVNHNPEPLQNHDNSTHQNVSDNGTEAQIRGDEETITEHLSQPTTQQNNGNAVEPEDTEQRSVDDDYDTDSFSFVIALVFFFLNNVVVAGYFILDLIQHTQLQDAITIFVNSGEQKMRVVYLCIPAIVLFLFKIVRYGVSDMINFWYTPESFFDLAVFLFFADCVFRYVTYFAKVLVILFAKKVLFVCKSFSMIESLSLAIRIVLPTFIMYNYFSSVVLWNMEWTNTYFVMPFVWLYMLARCYLFVQFVAYFFQVFLSLFTKTSPFGTSVMLEEGQEDICLICQDKLTNPVKLKCGHIFCEECIFKWLVQQPRCPICRDVSLPKHAFIGFNGSTRLLPTSLFF
ncbi:hypothetical protein EIN_250890 [Entamoeba invadens IP1]|uniref:RING-type domain-containing protein n=1 Tax=Entamoeba invadens IP1 TaxID=370355 RepID=A0A0A1UEE7_ENTIV|nr:hypothetical protein EIN_250890 [Entamoeba invadens IP1]ELP94955.1 hypothetical protein EIN_250890 [Entamoeba invadens IP1]|eukprot:XP_004261726.1 hypothetical protein EIN_250890 [Entamoeba invadens IP1]